ncbi:hypothetical protein JCM8097_004442 [Rhodosporidiobolus ruineniae]
MADTLSGALNTLAGLAQDVPQPFSSLKQLVEAEEKDAQRIRTSRVGWWRDVHRIRGSTIGRCWKAVVFFTLYATGVAVLDLVYDRSLGLTNNVTPMLSVVVGLLLVFRNGSAYARWDDGRKTFAKMLATTRNLSRTVWINVGAPPPAKGRLASDGFLKPPAEGSEDALGKKDKEDKVKALRLMVAFVVATKHHVRGEYGLDWPDLQAVLPPKFVQVARTTGFGHGAAEADYASSSLSPGGVPSPSPSPMGGVESLSSELRRVASKRSTSSLLSAAEEGASRPVSRAGSSVGRGERSPLLGMRRGPSSMSTDSLVVLADYMAKPCLPLPLVIANQLGLYFASCKRNNLLESIGPAGFNALTTALNSLVDSFTTCERLANVGIPTVYGIHLKQCTTLFLLTLPLVLVELMGFSMVPFVTVVAFTLVGIEAIASEIEMPFGIDDSDLPLDLFCAELRNEVEHMISRLPSAIDEWSL